jgi:hypothetical protein
MWKLVGAALRGPPLKPKPRKGVGILLVGFTPLKKGGNAASGKSRILACLPLELVRYSLDYGCLPVSIGSLFFSKAHSTKKGLVREIQVPLDCKTKIYSIVIMASMG